MWASLTFGIGAAALGLFLWRLALRYLRLRRAMRHWPRVPAQVLGYRSERSGRSIRVDVQVRYQYHGRTFDVWCSSPTGGAYGRGDVQASRQVAAKFPRGASREVFVNPATPEEAFLELPEPHMLALLLGGGAILIALALTPVSIDVFGMSQEIVIMIFMLVVAAALAIYAVFAAIALWRTPRPVRRRRPEPRPRLRRR
jgi:hypothetical protein